MKNDEFGFSSFETQIEDKKKINWLAEDLKMFKTEAKLLKF